MCSIFYDHWGQTGLIDGYWGLNVKTIKLEPRFEYDFLMKKIITKRLNLHDDCITDQEIKATKYNFLACVENLTTNIILQRLKTAGINICWIPQADYFIRMMNQTGIRACQTMGEMEAVSRELKYAMSKAINDKKCKRHCTSAHLNIKDVEIMINKADNDNISELNFQWEDDNVIIEEEYLLMDLNAIVSAVGGSLGLFLGFSCLQILLEAVQNIEHRNLMGK